MTPENKEGKSKKPKRPFVVRSGEADAWIRNNRGGLISNVANAITMMEELKLAYNAFTCRPFLTGPSPWGTKGEWTDLDDIKCAEWCQRNGLNVEKGTVADAAHAISFSRRPHYHPILEYLRGLKWDKAPRLDRWLYRYMGCPDDPYTRGVSAKWMMSAIKRVSDPNTDAPRRPEWNQADYTLVLEGMQGRRKSTALRTLAGPVWFSDDLGAEIPHKDAAAGLQGKWIIEIAELDAIRRVEITAVKAWLVRREDHYRPSYGRRARDFERQNVFAASTNKDQYIEDDTGGRRFWPVRVGVIDIESLERDRDQLWAEAYSRFMAGEKTYFDEAGESVAAEHQAERQVSDAWRERIEAWVSTPMRKGESDMRSRVGRVYLDDVLHHCLDVPVERRSQAFKNRISSIMKLTGWVKDREKRSEADSDGVQREYWTPMKKI